jgi:hypothetical protein
MDNLPRTRTTQRRVSQGRPIMRIATPAQDEEGPIADAHFRPEVSATLQCTPEEIDSDDRYIEAH